MQNKEKDSVNDEKGQMNEKEGADIKAEQGPGADENVKKEEGPAGDKKYEELNDKYLRLYSEFDNYRRRTIKEKSEILKTAAEDVFKAILPVMDDFERAAKANEAVSDADAIKQGYTLIYNKFKNAAQQKGLTAFDVVGQEFNPDVMEAITHIPATTENKKGTVIDEVEKGYKLGDKVIRFAKVVIAN